MLGNDAVRMGTHLRKTWQVDQGQAQDVGRVDFEVNGLSVDALVVACYSRRLILNLPFHFTEVVEAATHHVVELGPLILTSNTCGSVWDIDLIAIRFVVSGAWNIDELQNQRPARDNAASSGQKVPSYYVLEY